MNPQQLFRRAWTRYVVAIALVALAAALRIWPLQGLGLRIPYVTFYPAVMIASLYGGLSIGLLTAIFSVLTILFWSPTGQPFIKDSGDWLGIAVFFVNCVMISFIAEAMLRAQARAKKAQKQAEAANRAKSVFLSTMSHELRTPLNAILGFSALMRNDPGLTEGQRENLDIINRSGEHLLSLINDVLDMAKIEAGRIVLEIEPFDLGALVRDITDMLGKRAEERGLQLLLDQSSEFPRFIRSDKEKLRQVIVNLVSNAVKYTNHGGVTLRLGVQPGVDVLRLIIEVADSGVGISKDDQARIFEPFVQVGKPATQKGTGLGLSIVREYVELMGGNIIVESTPDTGSLFRVNLPVQRAEETEVMSTESAQGQVIGLASGQTDYRILIVEDQLENQLLLQRLLKDAGFSVKVAENGAEGVAMFQSYHPHFIWMDRRMPVMDGLEATKRIRALEGGTDVKIAAVTASAFADQREEMLAAGMNDFVRKPYRPAEIFDCLERQLGVRFVREQAVHAVADSALSPSSFANLPETLCRELADGLILGDTEQLARLILRIEQQDAALAKVLARHVADFDYLPILNALETNNKEAKP
ncbi:MAG: ATP-binding protein [Gallionella sp.]|jgi:signal transduction histidine kinase/CheY-like chemotaxis protein